MTDELGYGAEKRRQGNLDILSGKVTFRCVRVLWVVVFLFGVRSGREACMCVHTTVVVMRVG